MKKLTDYALWLTGTSSGPASVTAMARVGLLLMGLVLSLALTATAANAKTFKVKCDEGQSIQHRLDKESVQDGDRIEVHGACAESIEIARDHVSLVCVDGASITGVAGSGNTVSVRAIDVTVSGCTVSGGDANNSAIAVFRSGSATLTDNVVTGSNSSGISVAQNSYARITGGEVTGSGSSGINVGSGSMADIAGVNIHDNASNGVSVVRSAAADIVGNTIVDNASTGVFVSRTSSVAFSNDLTLGNAPNLIEGNDLRGIACFDNSALQFGAPQNYGAGNGNPSGTGPNTVFEGGGFCATSGAP